MIKDKESDWINTGKTIRELIEELQSFDNLDIEARISFDGGDNHLPISLVGKSENYCLLINSDDNND